MTDICCVIYVVIFKLWVYRKATLFVNVISKPISEPNPGTIDFLVVESKGFCSVVCENASEIV